MNACILIQSSWTVWSFLCISPKGLKGLTISKHVSSNRWKRSKWNLKIQPFNLFINQVCCHAKLRPERYWQGPKSCGGGGGLYLKLCCYHQNDSVLRWVAVRVTLRCINCEGQIHKMVFTNHNFSKEKRAIPPLYQTTELAVHNKCPSSPVMQALPCWH